jgi:adenylate kinase
MFIVIIAGPPGSGKGTQADMLAENLGLVHISTGDILRREIEAGTELGRIAKAKIDDGNFVPDDIACQMIVNVFEEFNDAKGFVFDGFPRTYSQCPAFEEILKPLNTLPDIFIELKVPENELTKRLLNRNSIMPRPDDSSIDIIKHRFGLYKDKTAPIINWYISKGIYTAVDGNGSLEQVFERIKNVLPEKIIK